MLKNTIQKEIHQLKNEYDKHQITAQSCINKVHHLQPTGLKIGMNIDNYLYRNGILNKSTAILSAKENIRKYQKFPSHKTKFEKELKMIKNSQQKWFNNYGIHDSPFHDLINTKLESYKVNGLLESLICDLYVGTYNEGSTKDLMVE